ncbi:hypothetical protein IEQ34_000185 [Dendrobium chrysotoxum]|uniref:Uncharacterized protein n=1 Tax=Dendrobium chrysotoxum TaxID=161865 RepID=A0AAV7HS17_DENCH|nr:hypothetical protein IEQ34_000185 [Dendrobium chrysotoxum]
MKFVEERLSHALTFLSDLNSCRKSLRHTETCRSMRFRSDSGILSLPYAFLSLGGLISFQADVGLFDEKRELNIPNSGDVEISVLGLMKKDTKFIVNCKMCAAGAEAILLVVGNGSSSYSKR